MGRFSHQDGCGARVQNELISQPKCCFEVMIATPAKVETFKLVERLGKFSSLIHTTGGSRNSPSINLVKKKWQFFHLIALT